MWDDLHVGATVVATDAGGDEHRGVITYGPARDRDGVQGHFVKVWLRLEGRGDEIPWPVDAVRAVPDPGQEDSDAPA